MCRLFNCNCYSPLLSVTQSTQISKEVEHPHISVQPLQSRIPALPTIPRPGAQVTSSTAQTTNLSGSPSTLGERMIKYGILQKTLKTTAAL